MVIKESKGNIQTYGDVKEFKISVDPRNLEFITTLLSSNLYSDPEGSFIREIVSNAWDSHVEAGTTDKPVIIKTTKVSNDKFNIIIRDYGTGLSPERYKDIYCNIGSSTKRDTNDYIGGFGLGRFSALAVSNSVYITSYYNGIAYHYILMKSGNNISSNLLHTENTEEPNGVDVTVQNIDMSKLDLYKKAMSKIVFFPNIYISGIVGDELNSIKIKKFKHFSVVPYNLGENRLLIGNVLYPFSKTLLDKDCVRFLSRQCGSGVAVKFDIGELEVTPNRESIIYNSEALKIINSRIYKVINEIQGYIKSGIERDYTDLYDYVKLHSNYCHINLLEEKVYNTDHSIYCNPIEVEYGLTELFDVEKDFTYKGEVIPRLDCYKIRDILGYEPLNFKCIFSGGIFIKNPTGYRVRDYVRLRPKDTFNSIIILNRSSGKTINLTEPVKTYIKTKYPSFTVILSYFDNTELYNYISGIANKIYTNEYYSGTGGDSNKATKIVYDYLIEYYKTHTTVIDIDTDPNILKIQQKIKDERTIVKGLVSAGKKIILYKRFVGDWAELSNSYDTFNEVVNELKKLHSKGKKIVLSYIDEANVIKSRLECLNIRNKYSNFVVISARKDVVQAIDNLNLGFILDPERIISNRNKLLCKLLIIHKYIKMTCISGISDARYHMKEVIDFIVNYIKLDYVTNDDLKLINEYLNIMGRSNELSHFDIGEVDESLYQSEIKLCKDVSEYVDLVLKICAVVSNSLHQRITVTSCGIGLEFILKLIFNSGKMRLNKVAFKKLKTNYLITNLNKKSW